MDPPHAPRASDVKRFPNPTKLYVAQLRQSVLESDPSTTVNSLKGADVQVRAAFVAEKHERIAYMFQSALDKLARQTL
jgi:hypothetical protein